MAWTDFEHSVWKILKDTGLDQRNQYYLAISGGLDSVVLLHVMQRLKPQAKLTVAYYHHGDSAVPEQQQFRDACFEHLKKHCTAHPNLQFLSERSAISLKSEAEFRAARWNFFKKSSLGDKPILTAHQLDDWVETLTLKLIRGVGTEGFTAFEIWNGEILRPLLEHSKKNLLAYANEQQLQWLEDPSNSEDQHLRNWLRLEWFKSLDDKNPSGYENYSRSLLRLCQELQQSQTLALQFYRNSPDLGLDRLWYFSLTSKSQLKALSLFLRHHSISNVTSGQLAEIQKRLDKNQKDITFTLAHVKWVINETQIVLVLSK